MHFSRIDIDANQVFRQRHLEHLGRLGAELGTDDEDDIGLLEIVVDNVAGRPEASERERMIFGNRALAHDRGQDWSLQPLGELQHERRRS